MPIDAGRMRHLVALSNSPDTPDDTQPWTPLTPERVWALIEPLSPSGEDHAITHAVTIRFHPQVSFHTRVTYGTRQLFVKGLQNVEERGIELRLLCEETVTP